jgi:pimeloyl-ACP methyl ester carboxylesterase
MSRFEGRTYLSGDGLRLYYRDYPGPPDAPLTVLCLPGLTRNSRDFEAVAAHFAASYRVLCADLRGRGRSEHAPDPATYQPGQYAADVGRLLDAAGVAAAAFVGTSLGGLVSMLCANLMRPRVKAVVLNDVGPELEPDGIARVRSYVGKGGSYADWPAAAAAVKALNAHVYPSWTEADWIVMAQRLCAVAPDGTIRPDYDPRIAVPFNAEGPAPNVDLWQVFANLKGLPVLALRGALSDILSAATLAKMKTTLADMTAVEVPGVGHAPYLMEPAARAALEKFLADRA